MFCFFLFSSTRPVCYSTNDGSIYNDLNDFNLWRLKYNKTYENKINLTDKDIDGIYDLMIFDKKNTKGTVNYVLLDQSGKPIIDQQVNKSVFIDSFTYYGM